MAEPLDWPSAWEDISADLADISVNCPLCDGTTPLTRDSVVEHLLSGHPPLLLATWIALALFLADDETPTT